MLPIPARRVCASPYFIGGHKSKSFVLNAPTEPAHVAVATSPRHRLITVLRNNWAGIEGKCGVTTEELDRAERLSHRMLRVVGLREQAAASKVTADQRDRAFTLFINCYDEIQRVVSFLRWKEDDADTIAPTLYAHRPRKARNEFANGTGCFLYPTSNAGTSKASQAFWHVDDIEREVAELKARGVKFEPSTSPERRRWSMKSTLGEVRELRVSMTPKATSSRWCRAYGG